MESGGRSRSACTRRACASAAATGTSRRARSSEERLLDLYGAQPDAMAGLDARGGGGGKLDDRKGTPRPGDSPRPDLSGDPQHTALTVDEQNVDREAHEERVNGV